MNMIQGTAMGESETKRETFTHQGLLHWTCVQYNSALLPRNNKKIQVSIRILYILPNILYLHHVVLLLAIFYFT